MVTVEDSGISCKASSFSATGRAIGPLSPTKWATVNIIAASAPESIFTESERENVPLALAVGGPPVWPDCGGGGPSLLPFAPAPPGPPLRPGGGPTGPVAVSWYWVVDWPAIVAVIAFDSNLNVSLFAGGLPFCVGGVLGIA